MWNCSEVALRFRIAVLRRQRKATLEFTNLDTGLPINFDSGENVNGYSHVRVRMSLTPREAGTHSVELDLTNLNDGRDSRANTSASTNFPPPPHSA